MFFTVRLRAASGLHFVLACLLAGALAACSKQVDVIVPPAYSEAEAMPGGEGSVHFKPFASSEKPAANLPEAQRPEFYAGKALANQPWVKAPTITDARDGLGPLYNARTCLGCHVNGGRGPMPEQSELALFTGVLRLSIPGDDKVMGAVPTPVYGDQIQSQSVALSHQLRGRIEPRDPDDNPEAPPEARVYLDWEEQEFVFPDGSQISLRRPMPRLEEIAYGPLPENTLTSLRAAPAIHGAGLLEAIAQADIDALADPNDEDGNGVSGRVNTVWDFERGAPAPGRFGWKANRSSLRITVAAAFQGDVGISNPLFPEQPCTATQARCLRTVDGNNSEGFELPADLLDLTTGFVRNIGVPRARERNAEAKAGRDSFYQVGCADCHHASFVTATESLLGDHLAGQTIWPYTDLLLHDMGPQLADHRADYDATGSEWRTPPLWGIGLSTRVNGVSNFLHDGRARTLQEAILWHGGEAERSRADFAALPAESREALIAFLETL